MARPPLLYEEGTMQLVHDYTSSEPQAQCRLQTAHCIGARGQPELSIPDDRIPGRECHVVQDVRRFRPKVDIEAVTPTECTAERGVQIELTRPRNRIPSRIPPLPGR